MIRQWHSSPPVPGWLSSVADPRTIAPSAVNTEHCRCRVQSPPCSHWSGDSTPVPAVVCLKHDNNALITSQLLLRDMCELMFMCLHCNVTRRTRTRFILNIIALCSERWSAGQCSSSRDSQVTNISRDLQFIYKYVGSWETEEKILSSGTVLGSWPGNFKSAGWKFRNTELHLHFVSISMLIWLP